MAPEPFSPVGYLEWNAQRRPEATAVWDGRDIPFSELLDAVRAAQGALARI